MNKKIIFTCVVALLSICSAVAQKPSVISSTTLKNLVGCWQGTLNYSGTIIRKPYTTTAELIVRQIAKSNKFEIISVYTKDASENVADTFTISKDGRKLDTATIKSKRTTKNGTLEITTEALDFDQDYNKSARVRKTYTIGKLTYTYKQQIQLEGQTDWLDREEFKYVRKACATTKSDALRR